MKSLSKILEEKDRVKELARDPRQKMLDTFWQRINAERTAVDMKPLPFVAVSEKVRHLDLNDLGFFLKKCQNSSNFSRTFFGLLKVKK